MKNATMLALSLVVTSGCASIRPDVLAPQGSDQRFTLRYFTGSEGYPMYKSGFEARAKELCPNGYKIDYEGFEPPTIPKELWSKLNYTWVIRCGGV
jgi:hypothetical protein